MIEVVIVNSPLFRNPNNQGGEDYLPPIGLGYIATSLQRNNISVELIDSVALNISLDDLLSRVREVKPEYLGINIFSTNFSIVKDFIEAIDFDVHIIIGGLSTRSLYPKVINWETNNKIDIVTGDGELIILDIIKGRVNQDTLYKSDRRRVYKVGPDSPYFVRDITASKLNRGFFTQEPARNYYGDPEISIISSRGCLYNCSFCAAARTLNKDYPVRARPPESLFEELTEIKEQYPKAKSIRILDDLFLKSAKSIESAIDLFRKFDYTWRSMAHIRTFNNIPQKTLSDLCDCGCIELFIGIESGSPNILKAINKTHDINLIKSNLGKIFKAGISVKAYFICGFPDETKEDLEKTYKLALELKRLSIELNSTFRTSVFQFRPYHGTLIYENLAEGYPGTDIFDLSPNIELTGLVGRPQYNFEGMNFSKTSSSIILDYICKINIV